MCITYEHFLLKMKNLKGLCWYNFLFVLLKDYEKWLLDNAFIFEKWLLVNCHRVCMGVYFCVHALEYFAILVLPNEIYNMATDFLFLVPFSVKMIKTYFTNSYSKLLTSILCAIQYLLRTKEVS